MTSLCGNAHKRFPGLVSSIYESECVTVGNQRDGALALGTEACENAISDLSGVCKCGIPLKTKVLTCFAILL